MRGVSVPLLGGAIEAGIELSDAHFKVRALWRRHAYPARGITNCVLNAKGETIGYALFGDYDNTTLADVKARIEKAILRISIGQVYVLRSSRHSFHAIIPCVYSFEDAVLFTAITNSGHDLTLFQKERELTLRTTPKNGLPITLVETGLGNNQPDSLVYSEPHTKFLMETYGVKKPDRKLWAGEQLEFKNFHYYNR